MAAKCMAGQLCADALATRDGSPVGWGVVLDFRERTGIIANGAPEDLVAGPGLLGDDADVVRFKAASRR